MELAQQHEVTNYQTQVTLETVRQFIPNAQQATNQELHYFVELCKARGLNPFLKEVHFMKYGNMPATIVVGKDAVMSRACKMPEYEGFEAGYFTKDGQEAKFPVAGFIGAWCRVFLKNRKHVESAALLSEYIQTNREGKPNAMWASKPATMIRKVALVQAHREAFPESFAGMYEAEEMPIHTPPINVTPQQPPIQQPPIQQPPIETVTEEQIALAAQFQQELGNASTNEEVATIRAAMNEAYTAGKLGEGQIPALKEQIGIVMNFIADEAMEKVQAVKLEPKNVVTAKPAIEFDPYRLADGSRRSGYTGD